MKKVLLIEDDPFLIDIYVTKLKEADFQVEVAENGQAGIEKIKKTEPDLLILDIILPRVDGWELLKQIRKDQKIKKLKVVILSNLGEKNEVEKGFELGAIKYFVKAEYTPSEVVEEIKKILK